MTRKVNTPKAGNVGTRKTWQEPKRLSKLGIWMKNNPEGIFEVLDRRAVNR